MHLNLSSLNILQTGFYIFRGGHRLSQWGSHWSLFPSTRWSILDSGQRWQNRSLMWVSSLNFYLNPNKNNTSAMRELSSIFHESSRVPSSTTLRKFLKGVGMGAHYFRNFFRQKKFSKRGGVSPPPTCGKILFDNSIWRVPLIKAMKLT